MATQNNGFEPVKFSITTPFHNVRLVEVPEEVLSIVEASRSSKNKSPILKFKSAPTSSSTSAALTRNSSTNQAKDSILHLCSEDKSWAIKQVSTSNSVYLIQPSTRSPAQANDHDSGETVTNTLLDATRGSVTATSQVRNFLELHPVKIDEDEIELAITELVPLHKATESDAEVDPMIQARQDSKQSLSFDELIANIASPDSIARSVCARFGVFEVSPSESPTGEPRCYVPSVSALFTTWAKILQSSAIELIKLDHAINEQRIAATLSSDIDKALALTMLKPLGMFEQHGLFESAGGSPHPPGAHTRYLKPQETVAFIAKLLARHLATRTTQLTGEIECDSFIRQWTDLVPSTFVKHCDVGALRSAQGSAFTITIVDGVHMLRYPARRDGPLLARLSTSDDPADQSSNNQVGTNEAPQQPASSAANKRKWHEKFGAQRNLKK